MLLPGSLVIPGKCRGEMTGPRSDKSSDSKTESHDSPGVLCDVSISALELQGYITQRNHVLAHLCGRPPGEALPAHRGWS